MTIHWTFYTSILWSSITRITWLTLWYMMATFVAMAVLTRSTRSILWALPVRTLRTVSIIWRSLVLNTWSTSIPVFRAISTIWDPTCLAFSLLIHDWTSFTRGASIRSDAHVTPLRAFLTLLILILSKSLNTSFAKDLRMNKSTIPTIVNIALMASALFNIKSFDTGQTRIHIQTAFAVRLWTWKTSHSRTLRIISIDLWWTRRTGLIWWTTITLRYLAAMTIPIT